MVLRGHFPAWLRKPIVASSGVLQTRGVLEDLRLHTVCQEACCPNQAECFSRRVATFMILGDTCTRGCAFCAVTKGRPERPDPQEPNRVAEAVSRLGLRHVVVTSVTRDDLPDGGAAHFAATVAAIRDLTPRTSIEILIPDFLGRPEAIAVATDSRPDVLGHNLETVTRLYPRVRPQATFTLSLNLLKVVKEMNPAIATKSGLMLGLGERQSEVLETMRQLRAVDCDLLTIGQYLCPGDAQLPVEEYVEPELYDFYAAAGAAMGFSAVEAGPWVRSSYQAERGYGAYLLKKEGE